MFPSHTLGSYVELKTWWFGYFLTIIEKEFLIWSYWMLLSLDYQSSPWVRSITGLLSFLRVGEGETRHVQGMESRD